MGGLRRQRRKNCRKMGNNCREKSCQRTSAQGHRDLVVRTTQVEETIDAVISVGSQ